MCVIYKKDKSHSMGMGRLLGFLTLLLICAISAAAYSGSYGIFPSPAGGPTHISTGAFQINTAQTNPQYINVNMDFVKSVTISTLSGRHGGLIVREYPSGGNTAFAFTVPQPIQNDLQWAIIEFWGANTTSLSVWHSHAGGTPYQEVATEVQPIQYDSNGNKLWQITVTSFSEFFVETSDKKIPLLQILLLAGITLCAAIVFWE